MLITENQLDEWVRANSRDAEAVIVNLVRRLVAASCPQFKELRFPQGDSVGQPGPDGALDVDFPLSPFVPEGKSIWEIGTGGNPGSKATTDYNERTRTIPPEIRTESTFVFVTPRSGRREWAYTWKQDAQAAWLDERRARGEWRDVRVMDGTRLVEWLTQFPAVDIWLSHVIGGVPPGHVETPEQRWEMLRSIGEPPPLSPRIFLTGRQAACSKLDEVLGRRNLQLRLDTRFPRQMANFVSAYIASRDDDVRMGVLGRCLLVSSIDAWNVLASDYNDHILVADFDVGGEDEVNVLQRARKAGHSVIFSGMPGGAPHPSRGAIPNPKDYELKAALAETGYTEERARVLSQKSNGNLTSLLKLLQNISLMPAWAEETWASDLAIAALLGGWNDQLHADRSIAEKLSGKSFGEWIAKMREILLRPTTPLTHRDGIWKFTLRYEGWDALGPRMFDDHLERLRAAAVEVLSEPDPKFELPADERLAAQVHGKVLAHSPSIRTGLAETLALLGSHPKALSSASVGKSESTAILAVREMLKGADWVRWASLDRLLPLLAEAAPSEFLDAVEETLADDPSPFDALFAQETAGVTGGTYISGLLWALESLAWDQEHFVRAVVNLAELAARDPGGNWANRPANSLSTILLPWLPQTTAPVDKRVAAVSMLLDEAPAVAWKLLLSLLPQSHSTSSFTHRPTWREIIPDDWSSDVTISQYWDQVALYAGLAIQAASSDVERLGELIERFDDLPLPAHEQLVDYLESDSVVAMSDMDKLRMWNELTDVVTKHRKYADAEWAMTPEQVEKIAAVAQRLEPEAPGLRYRRLFSERELELYDETGDWQDQQKRLEERRQQAVAEVAGAEGPEAVADFADMVESPWQVGMAFGMLAGHDADGVFLPGLLSSERRSQTLFVWGFVRGRFRSQGWRWVDELDKSKWGSEQTAQLFAYLPFTSESWERVKRSLEHDEGLYWTKANVNPYEGNGATERAVEALLEHGRPLAAIRCIYKVVHNNEPIQFELATRALLAVPTSSEGSQQLDAFEIVEVVKALQNHADRKPKELLQVEWAYVPLLHNQGASPVLLERQLANDPSFFCDVVRRAFRSKTKGRKDGETSEEAKNIATNAYRLLSRWTTPPGLLETGEYDGDAFNAWLDAVKKESTETGHYEVSMTMVGHMLVHVPSDPDGLWIHRAAAAALNAKDASDMRDGYRTQLFNSRGVHGFTSGEAELALADQYRSKAEAVESRGFHRLATTLRELAQSYQHYAERDANRDPFDDD